MTKSPASVLSVVLTVPTLLLLALSAPASAQMHHMAPMPSMSSSSASVPSKPLPGVTVQGATIVAVPPSIKETSAFMVLRNTGKQPVVLTGASAAVAGHAMLMTTIKSANMMGMLPASTLTIPAGGTLTLKSDGNHIMLTDLKRPLKVGETLPIVLSGGQGQSLTIKATVKKP